jgi:hypothetical protein
VDAAPAKDSNDYVILDQLNTVQDTLNQSISDNVKKLNNQINNIVTESHLIVQYSQASAQLTLTTMPQNIIGASVVVNKAGRWLVNYIVGFVQNGNENGATLAGIITVDGTQLSGWPAVFFNTGNVATQTASGATCSNQYVYVSNAAPHTLALQAYKTTGVGSSYATLQSNISALWVSE